MRSEREEALIQETRAIWQEAYSHFVSEDEAKDILANMTDLFNLLNEWDQQSNAACSDEHAADEIIGGEHAA
ncbi:MAG: hypothetical protein ABL983_00290 [Nitrospira sp.]